jgi:hypothetical protein
MVGLFDIAAGGAPAQRVAADMEQAARSWLESLDEQQRPAALFPSPLSEAGERERLQWFYTPTDHGGLALGDQGARQQGLAMQLVATGLSPAAYVTVMSVIGLENVLDLCERWPTRADRERSRDPGLYWLRLFGEPGSSTWGWRFGGHHVSLNYLIIDGLVASTTPCFIGANPASSALLGEGVLAPLGGTENLARQLMTSLNADQTRRATLHTRPVPDIVSGNRAHVAAGDQLLAGEDLWRSGSVRPRRPRVIDDEDTRALALTQEPRGISGERLADEQRRLLRAVLHSYVGRAPTLLAASHEQHYANDDALNRVHLGWAGSLQQGEPHYYRLQGPGLLIEYDNTQNEANHAHSVWRDPDRDFGIDALADHYARQHRASR